jgi:hypothetical protein
MEGLSSKEGIFAKSPKTVIFPTDHASLGCTAAAAASEGCEQEKHLPPQGLSRR